MLLLCKPRVPFGLHHFDDRSWPVFPLLRFLQVNLVHFRGGTRAGGDELHHLVRNVLAVRRLPHEGHAIGKPRIIELFRRQTALELRHERPDMKRQVQLLHEIFGYPLIDAAKLNAEGLLGIQRIFIPEQLLDGGIEIERRSLELRAQCIVDTRRHLVLDFVADADEKPKIRLHQIIERAVGVIQALPKAQVPIGAKSRCFETLALPMLGELPVFNFLFPKMRMKHVRPSDHRGDDEQFRLELNLRIVEDLDGGEHSLPGLLH